MHLLTIGIEQKTQFVDSTLLRKLKFECLECEPNSRDASMICFLQLLPLQLLIY